MILSASRKYDIGRHRWEYISILLVCFIFVDDAFARFLHAVQIPPLIEAAGFLSSLPFYPLLFTVPLAWRKGRRRAWPNAWWAVLCAFLLSTILKTVFAGDRPFVVFGWDSPEALRDFGFPSGHAAAAFALVPFAKAYGTSWQYRLWMALAGCIVFSRLVLSVHFASDVVAGAWLGLEVGNAFARKDGVGTQGIGLLKTLLSTQEMRRQILHLLVGTGLTVLIAARLLTTEFLFALIAAGTILVVLQKQYGFSWLDRILSRVEREADRRRFPGKGALLLCLGSYLALVLFDLHLALASIVILAFGDGLANIVGHVKGSWKILYNPSKHWEGTMSGIVAGTAAAAFFVPWQVAAAGSAVAMLVETLPLTFGPWKVDDNLTIPLVAGLAMTAFTALTR